MYSVEGHMNRKKILTEEDAVLIRTAGILGGWGGGKIFVDADL